MRRTVYVSTIGAMRRILGRIVRPRAYAVGFGTILLPGSNTRGRLCTHTATGRGSHLCVLLGATALLLGSVCGCGSTTSNSGSRRGVTARQAQARTSSSSSNRSGSPGSDSPAATQRFQGWMRECASVSVSSVASAYDMAFNRGQVSSVFGARESLVTATYNPASPEALDGCDYNAKLAGYGPYAIYSVEWTSDPSLVAKFLTHRSSETGDSGFTLVEPPPPFTTAYEDNGGLFLARPGIAVTLGGALGSGVNSVLDPSAETKVSACLARDSC